MVVVIIAPVDRRRHWLIHLADYEKILYDAAIELGVRVLLRSPVEIVEEHGPAVVLKNGQQLSADLVVGR